MGGLVVDQLRVRFAGRAAPALRDVSLAADAGEVLALAGRTGAGKSTLCLAAAGLLPRVVRAAVSGSVRVGTLAATTASASELAGEVGIVFSSPALQLSASKPTVREELAFGLENLAVPRAEMDARISSAMERLDIAHLAERDPLTLSGGEQQRVAIASIVVMGTGVVVLDEPAAQLDPQGTADIAAIVREMADDGRAVLVAEHAPDVLAAAGRCALLDSGQVVVEDAPGAALGDPRAAAAGIEPPTIVALAAALDMPAAQAFDEGAVAEAIADADREQLTTDRPERVTEPVPPAVRDAPRVAVEVRGLVHEYAGGVLAVRGVDLTVEPGSSIAIVGQNGSGKTTLIKHLNGLLRPTAGTVEVDGRDISGRYVSDLAALVGFVFQNPDDQLFNGRVDREVSFGARNLGLGGAEIDRLVDNALSMTYLDPLRATNPYDLDVSLRKLVALAGVLAMEPPVLVLDEPTMGQDAAGRRRIGSIIDAWAAAGRTVIAVTHDMEFAARHFRRIVVMRGGEIVLDGTPANVFSAAHLELLGSTGLRPPPIARIAARLGLEHAPATAAELVDALVARSGGVA